MKRITLLLFVLLTCGSVSAQLTKEQKLDIHPELESSSEDFKIGLTEIEDLLAIQEQSIGKDVLYPISKLIPIELDLMQKFKWHYNQDGDRIGKLKISSRGSTGLGLFFEEFYLPIGAKLYLYSPSTKQRIGPYTFTDNPTKEGRFGSGSLNGSEIIFELVLNQGVTSNAILKADFLEYQRDPEIINASRDFGDAEDCQINIACEEGDNWQDQKNSVVRIKMIFAGFAGWCTGTIMNNTIQDCTPYILTADHCRMLSDGTVAEESEYANWEFYYLYESDKCANPKESDVTVSKMTGCTRKASSSNGGEGDSDFLLLLLNNSIPSFYNAFFAGWDNRNIPPNSGVMIHHPAGDIKKISTIRRQAESSEWDENLATDSHWKVFWKATTNGHGVSQGGSSGSALWNQDKRVTGQLTGGSSACDDGSGTGPNNPDYYGKMSYNWNWDITDSSKNLKNWLDYGQSNLQYIDGIFWPCSELPLTAESNNKSQNQFSVWPLPANQVVHIKFGQMAEEKRTISVHNMGGKLVFETETKANEIRFDVHAWPSGMYLVKSLYKGNSMTQKILVQ